MLLTETDGYTKEETEYQMRKIIEVFRANHPREIKQARSDKEAEELWLARKSAYAVLARIKTHFILEDITVPMARVAEMLKGIDAIAAKHQLQIATFGHAGDRKPRGVGRNDAPGFADLVDPGEDLLLDVETLDHDLDDPVAPRQPVPIVLEVANLDQW